MRAHVTLAEPRDHVGHTQVERPAFAVGLLQGGGARVARAGQHEDAPALAAALDERSERVVAQIGIDRHGVGAEAGQRFAGQVGAPPNTAAA